MLKKKFLLLLAAPLLVLTACNKGPASSQELPPEPESSVEQEYLDPGMQTVAFDEISNLVMINEKAQAYIDAMHAEEEYSDCPYTFAALDDDLDKVDVKDMLTNSDNSKNRPITISWDKGDLEYERISVVLCKDWKFQKTTAYPTTGNSVEIDNLERATTYYYRLETADGMIRSQVQKFTTADYTRSLNFDGNLSNTIFNARDLGGYMTSFGIRTNQGLIFRGSEINGEDFTADGQRHNKNVDELVLEKNEQIFKIGVELDLRTASGANNMTASALPTAEYIRRPFTSYANFIKNPDNGTPGTLKDVFDLFANADEKHVYYHCWGGADRTGALSFFLNGVCGVSLTDLYIDFELTSQHNSVRSHLTKNGSYDFPGMLTAIKELPYYSDDKTIAEICYQFLTEHGIEEDTIERIREVMIPGYYTGMEEIWA